MMLATPLSQAIKTTSLHLKRLEELGLVTVADLLGYFPHKYTDLREVRRIIEVEMNELNTVRGTIKSIATRSLFRRRMSITTALVSDESGSIEAVWFRQPFLSKMLQTGQEVMLSGKVKYDEKKRTFVFQSPAVELIRAEQVHTARIIPIYHETELSLNRAGPSLQKGKISSKWIREKLFPLLPSADAISDFLPEKIRSKNGLLSLPQAIKHIHFPGSERELDLAKKRLAFDEFFILQLAALYRRHQWRKIAVSEKKQIPPDWELMKKFTFSLPWALTNAQKKAVYEVVKDLGEPFPMSRLLEGDTGSGKTVVAAAAILTVLRAGFQACLLAPTEILARQHFESISKILAPFEIKPALILGATPEKEKAELREGLQKGKIPLIIGTHVLLQEKIRFKNLGLAVIDEQHRFGVRQRELLKSHGSPHVLSLSATPIPRTLALVLYGDQDLSVLDEMPPGRQKIITRIVPESKRKEAYEWIKKELGQGRQVFIIFPLIEESEALGEVKAVTQEYERLANEVFIKMKIAMLHGQMPSAEKAEVMRKFNDGATQILLSTAVVEVGVDVPNATIIMIEGAERFGLAQLHQFRGRVGRGDKQSYCLLFPTVQTPQAMKRLHALTTYHSGFKLAEVDLQLRGPGEVYGTAQSGIPDLKMANLSDATTMKQARDAVLQIMEEDPELVKYPELKKKIGACQPKPAL